MDLIVPAYNNLDITFRCLAALRLFAPPDTHVILVDNGSRGPIDALRAPVESMEGTYLRLDPNRGPYGAVNAGFALARSDVIGVVCNDVVVMPGALQAMQDVVASGAAYVGATGIVEPAFDYYGLLARAAIQGRLSRAQLYQGFHFSCFLATRALYDRVGLYDERFRLTYGDTDHEQRIADAGITPVRVTNALVYHGHGTGRKRGVIEQDIQTDLRDYDTFAEKWKDRPDVLARHPRETPEQKRAFLETQGWTEGEQ